LIQLRRHLRLISASPGTSSPVDRLLQRTGLTWSGIGLLLVAAGGWVTARYLGGRTLYLMVYGGFVILGIAYYLGRHRQALDGKRSDLPARVRQGQKVEVELLFSAKRRVSGLVVEERMHPHLGRSKQVTLEGVSSGAAVRRGYQMTPQLRGVYQVGPLRAVWSDPFGFTRHERTLAEPVELIVHPATEMVHDRPLTRQWEDPPVRPPVSKPWPSGFEFYGMRDYQPGDDPRRIVWRAVARSGKVLVREFEQGITDRVTIVLDTDERYHAPGAPSDTFEAGVKTAASLGVRHLRDGFAVTLEANASRRANGFRGPGSDIRLLDLLAAIQPDSAPLGSVIDRMVADPRRDAHILIITPHLDDHAAARLQLLVQRGVHVELVALIWEDSDPHTLATAAALGCQVVQLHPHTPLEAVFAHEMGAGRR
jgi:uncharacterized protein (DUF58 family)